MTWSDAAKSAITAFATQPVLLALLLLNLILVGGGVYWIDKRQERASHMFEETLRNCLPRKGD